MIHLVSTAYLFLFVCVFSVQIHAQDWISPLSGNSLGAKLETEYDRIVQDCRVGSIFFVKTDKASKPLKDLKDNDKVKGSAIPVILQNELKRLNEPVAIQEGESINRLFAYIYPSKFLPATFSDRWLLYDKDFFKDPKSMIPFESNRTIYSHNCSGIVSSAINGKAGYSIPLLNIKTAMENEFQGSTRTALALVEGRFNSPFNDFLGGNRVSPEKLSALLILWNWYDKNPALANQNLYRISDFNGISLYRFNEVKRNNRSNVLLDAGINYFATVETKNSLSLINGFEATVDRYFTYAYLKNPKDSSSELSIEWQDIPKPAEIKTSVATSFQTKLKDGYTKVIGPTGDAYHSQYIEGIPESLCSDVANYWTPVMTNVAMGTISFSSITKEKLPVDESNPRANKNIINCYFNMKYTPSAAARNDTTGES